MGNRGHNLFVMSTDTKSSLDLLKSYGIEHYYWKKTTGFNPLKIKGQIRQNYQIWKKAVEFKPDFLTAIGGTSISHVSRFVDAKSIVFTDTEHAKIGNMITFPFSDYICTPDCYLDDLGPKQIRYPGYHELAYLHPNRFTPDPSVLDYIDADRDDKIVILRLIAWGAVHDLGQGGFSDIGEVISRIESTRAKVVITSESEIPEEAEHCQYNIPPHKMHDLMYYSNLFIGESGTMSTESAILGTPALHVTTLWAGVLNEIEERYGLVYNFSEKNRQKKAVKTALNILTNYKNNEWKLKRIKLLNDKIDVTRFMLSLFESYNDKII